MTTILYHANCPDGFGAATAAWLKLGPDAQYLPVSYGKPLPPLEAGGTVFILDFSYPAQTLLELSSRMKRVVVLDHHATAQQDLAGLELFGSESEIVFDMAKSGAILAWEFFHGSKAPIFVQYLQDRDLWQFALPRSRELACALKSYPMEFVLWASFMKHPASVNSLKQEGVGCLRLTRQQVDNMARNARLAQFNLATFPASIELGPMPFELPIRPDGKVGFNVPAANATVFFSEVGERLLELYSWADCAAYYFDRRDGKRQWGLRSRETFDCSKIAKEFGGGGHKQASGFVQKLESSTSSKRSEAPGTSNPPAVCRC